MDKLNNFFDFDNRTDQEIYDEAINAYYLSGKSEDLEIAQEIWYQMRNKYRMNPNYEN